MFHIIPDAVAVTYSRGVWRQHTVYKYNGQVFIKHGGGYARVMKSGDTSIPNVRVDAIEVPWKDKKYTPTGYMLTPAE